MAQNEMDWKTLKRVRGPETPTTRMIPKSILKPSSSSIKSTHHGVSKKTISARPPVNYVTPSRGQPGQPSSGINNSEPLRARKSGAGKSPQVIPSISSNTHKRPSNVKTYKSLTPLDQQLDNEYEEKLLSQKRDRSGNMAGFAKRRTQMRRDANIGDDVLRLQADDPQHVVAQLSPIMKLRIGGQVVDPDEDEPRYRPQPKIGNVKFQNPGQRVLKAARKYQSVERSSSESDPSDSESDSSHSSSDPGEAVHREGGSRSKQDSDSEDNPMDDVAEDPPQLVFDEERMITAPLPDIDDVENPEDAPPAHQRNRRHGPSANLISAVEALALPVNYLRRRRRLPFLMQNLRNGFLKRCRELLVPIYPLDRRIRLQVKYTIAGEDDYELELNQWMCPICDLFGEFSTREMLGCHLQWDHQEVYCEWEDLGVPQIQSWKLEVLIQEFKPDMEEPPLSRHSPSPVQEETPERTSTPRTANMSPQVERHLTLEPQNDSGIFPSVSLSPRSTPRQSILPDVEIKREEIETSLELSLSVTSSSRGVLIRPSEISSSSGSGYPPLWSRLTPTAAAATTTTTTSSTSVPSARPTSARSTPPPPPPGNPLGPAAQPPYLPADYGGILVLHSCRTGGPCLFDLLRTLPMEPFGLLDWEVIDREEEIYESDDVKEEYKVMHALWGRWILLNRNKFISNYAKGVIAFLNEYWKMIHWAAGWEALRYFLYIFLANQFLTGHEVAQALTHYEELTGMASWYE